MVEPQPQIVERVFGFLPRTKARDEQAQEHRALRKEDGTQPPIRRAPVSQSAPKLLMSGRKGQTLSEHEFAGFSQLLV